MIGGAIGEAIFIIINVILTCLHYITLHYSHTLIMQNHYKGHHVIEHGGRNHHKAKPCFSANTLTSLVYDNDMEMFYLGYNLILPLLSLLWEVMCEKKPICFFVFIL